MPRQSKATAKTPAKKTTAAKTTKRTKESVLNDIENLADDKPQTWDDESESTSKDSESENESESESESDADELSLDSPAKSKHAEKTTDGKHGDSKSDGKQSDSKHGDSKQSDSKHGDSKHGDSKQSDNKQSDSKHGDSKQSDNKQSDSKHGDSKHGDSKQGDNKHGDSKQDDKAASYKMTNNNVVPRTYASNKDNSFLKGRFSLDKSDPNRNGTQYNDRPTRSNNTYSRDDAYGGNSYTNTQSVAKFVANDYLASTVQLKDATITDLLRTAIAKSRNMGQKHLVDVLFQTLKATNMECEFPAIVDTQWRNSQKKKQMYDNRGQK
jgi:hypothetical protein